MMKKTKKFRFAQVCLFFSMAPAIALASHEVGNGKKTPMIRCKSPLQVDQSPFYSVEVWKNSEGLCPKGDFCAYVSVKNAEDPLPTEVASLEGTGPRCSNQIDLQFTDGSTLRGTRKEGDEDAIPSVLVLMDPTTSTGQAIPLLCSSYYRQVCGPKVTVNVGQIFNQD